MSAPLLTIQAETGQLNAAFTRLANTTGKAFGAIVLQSSRLIAWNLAHNTQPYGMTLAEKKLGEAAVARDIGMVYRSAQKMFEILRAHDEQIARAWYKLVKMGGYAQAEKLLRSQAVQDRNAPIFGPLDPGFHSDSRNRRGRVSRHRIAQIVPDGNEIKAYIKQRQAHVGFAKAGWITAGSQLGKVTRVPAWITRHVGQAPGQAVDNSKRPDPHCLLTNNVNYISAILPPSEVASALRMQREKMTAHIEHVLAAEAEAAGFKFTGPRGTPLAAAA